MQIDTTVKGSAWISSNEDPENSWAEGEFCQIEVERTDTDEVRIGVTLTPNASDDVTLYLSASEAQRLMALLGAASIGVQVTA